MYNIYKRYENYLKQTFKYYNEKYDILINNTYTILTDPYKFINVYFLHYYNKITNKKDIDKKYQNSNFIAFLEVTDIAKLGLNINERIDLVPEEKLTENINKHLSTNIVDDLFPEKNITYNIPRYYMSKVALIKIPYYSKIYEKENGKFKSDIFNVKKIIDVREYFNSLNDENKLELIKKYYYVIRFIENPSNEMQLEAVRQNEWAFICIKNPTDEVKLEAIKKYPYIIENIKNPSYEMQMEAVKRNGNAIRYIKNPSYEIQMEAVKQNKNAIKHIKKS